MLPHEEVVNLKRRDKFINNLLSSSLPRSYASLSSQKSIKPIQVSQSKMFGQTDVHGIMKISNEVIDVKSSSSKVSLPRVQPAKNEPLSQNL